MNLRKKIVFLLPVVCMVFYFACSKSSYNNNNRSPGGGGIGGGNSGGSSVTITVQNMSFPVNTSVKKGTVVKWYNQDGYAHTVTSDDGNSFDSGNLASGATFSYTANTVGTFQYHCNIHTGMKGTLTVTN
ncbi:MAG: cupredoxin domain-containing protein [Bacteroidetes bacterium]|nr:cupredoxin domain-containing protein [Bacteroidota bacterium]MBS1929489.1 cupredoxin domain-containing protein [Bacteroidota bacterium]